MEHYKLSAAKSQRGQARRRIETLDGARQGVFVKHLNAIGKDAEVASQLKALLDRYDELIDAERQLYKYLYGKTKASPEVPPDTA